MGAIAKNIPCLLVFSFILLAKSVESKPYREFNQFNEFDWNNYGKALSQQINNAVARNLEQSGIYNMETLGTQITDQVNRELENHMWYSGPNVCVEEKDEDLNQGPQGSNNVITTGKSENCNVTNGIGTCVITNINTKDGKTTRSTKTYRCCDNFSLKYVGEKMQCA